MPSAIDDLPPPPQAKAASAGIDDLPPPPGPSFVDQSIKSTVNALPMIGATIGSAFGTPADVLTGPAGTIGGAAIGGYLGTAARNLINRYYDPDNAPKTMTDVIAQPIEGGAEQGLMQATGEAVAPYVAKAAQAAGGVVRGGATKLLSSLGGVKPDTIAEYAQFSDRINKAPTVEQLKDISDEFVGKLASDVDAKQISAQQAQDAYKGFQSDLKDQYKTMGYDARDAVNSAQQTLKDAHNARLQQLSGDVYGAINDLKSEVQSGSGNALKVLDKSNAKVDLAPTYAAIDSAIDKAKSAGTDEGLALADKLQAYRARLAQNNWASIPAPDAKKLIQGLDQTTTYSPLAGSFDQAKNAAFKGIRSALDQSVKSAVPEYAQAMQPVAANTSLLDRVSPFSDKQSAVNALSRINAPNQMENRAALQELGKKYNADFISGAQPENLPEYQILQKAQAQQDSLRPDIVSQKIDQTLANSRQRSALDQANSDYEAAQQKLAPFKPLAPNAAGQTTAQQKLTQLGKGNNIELTDMFQKLGNLTNTDFVQAMKDQNTLAAFHKGATNGSRNTLMGAVAGWLFGGPAGAAGGAAAGRAVDQWGPAITKRVLDGAIRVAKTPTVSTIAQLELPEAIKRNMVLGLENYYTQAGQSGAPIAEMAKVADSSQTSNRQPARGPAAWAQQGVQNLGLKDQSFVNRILQDPQGSELLQQASNYKPGSKALQQIMNQIQTRYGSKK